jgi:hypothetical protein
MRAADILFARGKQLYDRIISQKGEFWVHNTSLNPLHFIATSGPSQDS